MYSWQITKFDPEEPTMFVKDEWQSAKQLEYFYDEDGQENSFFAAEDDFIDVISLFMDELDITTLTVCELEKYNEYYGIRELSKQYSSFYPKEMLDLFETLKENDVLTMDKIDAAAKLIMRSHMWCVFKASGFEVRFGNDCNMFITSKEPCKKALAQAEEIDINIAEMPVIDF